MIRTSLYAKDRQKRENLWILVVRKIYAMPGDSASGLDDENELSRNGKTWMIYSEKNFTRSSR